MENMITTYNTPALLRVGAAHNIVLGGGSLQPGCVEDNVAIPNSIFIELW
jgi:hypothetical protein